ncbi:DISARM system helicase DrmA [Luteolibacter arcticus]|uniref:DISARM system helicase DrmA n=1 Tax=Luteolibacter arcticus TaxID=1581411 RepID=A0ABT3GL61_9BACT|nr:DISARM system helicase DrmA [Luteolibacter arcticus]MCW1924258.1 DISARM system helicase DrmA [Luteolibacter arcticus]
MTSRETRTDLAATLELDLIGPGNGHACAKELLSDSPTQWYLTGFLVPVKADLETRLDDTVQDEIDEAPVLGGFDDNAPVDRSASGGNYLPSSMGLTVIVPAEAVEIEVQVEWGDYIEERYLTKGEKDEPKELYGYRRLPKAAVLPVPLNSLSPEPTPLEIPGSRVKSGDASGMMLSCISRPAHGNGGLPPACRAVTVFLVNHRVADKDHSYRSCAFQAKLRVSCPQGLVGRPDLRGLATAQYADADHDLADLHFRDVLDYGIGHGVSVAYDSRPGAAVTSVETSWVPHYEVERVIASDIPQVEFGMAVLAAFTDASALGRALRPLVEQYRNWLDGQKQEAATLPSEKRKNVALHLVNEARSAADRIEQGIALLETNAEAFRAFTLANHCMLEAAARRLKELPRDQIQWRPFQLAFILLNLPGLADPQNDQRRFVELLFFPTGGGKTEAYLGLAAFQLLHRRLTYPGIRSAGVSVLMRYTLRLLTLDQLGRAAGLICALELERRKDPAALGEWPFEIGLWVGSGATPNRLGHRGYTGPGQDQTAYIKTKRFRENSSANPAPIPLESCPWCGERFNDRSFKMVPSEASPTNLQVTCHNYECDFSQATGLPILTVDEPIYRRLPCFLIATVDKFAALPWEGRAGALLGRVNRYDALGFYGPMDAGKGTKMEDVLPGPDLIIQDELHLISGPLGTIAGVYETAIEKLCERYSIDGQKVRVPKIIASTATVRRANRQIQALFGRPTTRIFPSPGIHRQDSFFARTVGIDPAKEKTNGRLYLGIAAQGRSLKKVFLRVSLAIMSRAQALYFSSDPEAKVSADPYMTLLGYFNSLRELGGSRRIVEDEVLMQLDRFANRRRLEPAEDLFTDRSIDMSQIRELTSRVSTKEVAETKEKMGKPHAAGEGCDVVLATNMISVGLDVTRLGLMLVLGQPKGSSEYIQATSRVGREVTRPGLVITLLNPHKPRDRSHFEQFQLYHQSFYRSVEATSVTPFSPRALDRALGATMVGMIRHAVESMTPALGAQRILTPDLNARLEHFCQLLAERARDHRPDELPSMPTSEVYHYVLNRCRAMVDDWKAIALEWQNKQNSSIQYQREDRQSGAVALLHDFLDTSLETLPDQFRKFRANRSMRDVETSTELSIKELNEQITGGLHLPASQPSA